MNTDILYSIPWLNRSRVQTSWLSIARTLEEAQPSMMAESNSTRSYKNQRLDTQSINPTKNILQKTPPIKCDSRCLKSSKTSYCHKVSVSPLSRKKHCKEQTQLGDNCELEASKSEEPKQGSPSWTKCLYSKCGRQGGSGEEDLLREWQWLLGIICC